MCLCSVCMSVFVCVSVVQDCVLCAPVPQLSTRLPLSCGPLSSGEKAVFQVSKDGERCPGGPGEGFGVLAREGVPGEMSPFCAKSLSAIGAMCAA